MAKQYQRALFIFRRDLRLADNTALARAADFADEVLPAFVFDPQQTDPDRNEYFSAHAFQFMVRSLEDLEGQLHDAGGRLYRFRGEAPATVARLIEEAGVDAVFVNRDYTLFSRARDGAIQEVCAQRNVPFHRSHDLLLVAPGQVLTGPGTPYQTYGSFARKARKEGVAEPAGAPSATWCRAQVDFAATREVDRELLAEPHRDLFRLGGRTEALEILDRVDRFGDYATARDIPGDEDGTTGLSPHHKFGTVSIREVYHAVARALGADHGLVDELYWRDFFTQLAFFTPQVFGRAFRRELDGIDWENDRGLFDAWRHGRTGFPIVDAGMRQLGATGFMHNRVRMVVASFLVKDLHVDWRWGERHFARLLVDYDPAVNNGNWQWAASTGADAQPFFRIFNPWRQQERFDPEAIYVKRWVPELAGLSAKAIHRLADDRPSGLDYPEPIVDHKERAAAAKKLFERAKG